MLHQRSMLSCSTSQSGLRAFHLGPSHRATGGTRPHAARSSIGHDEVPARKAEVQAWVNAWRFKQGLAPMPGTSAAALRMPPVSASASQAVPAPASSAVGEYLQLGAGAGVLYGLDYAIKAALLSQGITFPGPLIGMFGIVVMLIAVGEETANKLLKWFGPCLSWIAKWLPLFYVASLVTLPLGLNGIPSDQLIKIVIILAGGMVSTLLFTAQVAVAIRALVKTENKEVAKAKAASPFLQSHWLAWGAVAAISLGATVVDPLQWGGAMALPFNLACTMLGFLLGNAMPKAVQAVAHPVVMTALVANAGAALHGSIMGLTYDAAQKIYYTKNLATMGAGDLLSQVLGVVIISMGFRIYTERNTMRRHAPEIVGATLLSSLFSFFSTAYAAKALGLQSALARALIPRSVTVALALPIGAQLDAPLAIVACGVLIHAMLGANFGPNILTAFGFKDTISRGLAAAGTAGGFGTASLTAKEPEALPFCALSYSMVGILSTCLASLPFIRTALISITG